MPLLDATLRHRNALPASQFQPRGGNLNVLAAADSSEAVILIPCYYAPSKNPKNGSDA
jgi:hypothetical protein